MRHLPRVLFAVLVALALAALSCGVRQARVDDVTGGRARLLAVDGQPVRRARSKYVTRVPLALVDPGPHTFQVSLSSAQPGAPDETLLVQGTVTGGQRYRFESRGGTLQLVRARDGE
jgi:hypothetical protein